MSNTEKSLQEKINLSRKKLQEIAAEFDPARTAVAWTGGKDSTVVLYLWLQILLEKFGAGKPSPVAVNLDTGLKFPQILEFRDKIAKQWGISLHVARPGIDLSSYPLADDPVKCCRDLKIWPLKEIISRLQIDVLLTGLRFDEHGSRRSRPWLEGRQEPYYLQAHPVYFWTEMDVWSFNIQEDIPYCELYDQGYRSLGCRPCTEPAWEGERSGRNPDKENQLDLLHSLGYF